MVIPFNLSFAYALKQCQRVNVEQFKISESGLLGIELTFLIFFLDLWTGSRSFSTSTQNY